MAFTGSATVKAVSDRIVRITGLSLAGNASGIIGLNGATGSAPDVKTPATFQPSPYNYDGSVVALQDAISVSIAPDAAVANPLQVFAAKTGTTPADFRITVTNSSGSATPELEFYVRFHD